MMQELPGAAFRKAQNGKARPYQLSMPIVTLKSKNKSLECWEKSIRRYIQRLSLGGFKFEVQH